MTSEPKQQPTSPKEEVSPPLIGAELGVMFGILFVVVVVIAALLGYQFQWTGFSGKTLWDWFDLLIVPLALALVAYGFSRTQRHEDRKIAADQRQQDLQIAEEERKTERNIARDRNEEAELQTYFDRMSELMLDYGLRSPAPTEDNTTNHENISNIARARTLAVLRSVQDPLRKGSVVRFLYENGLIETHKRVVKLYWADLNDVDLSGADLRKANLQGANMQEAKLKWADLRDANLQGAKLNKANLSGALLESVNLDGANLIASKLWKASLQRSKLRQAKLIRANLWMANLERAVLTGAHLQEATLTDANLIEADLTDANLGGVRTDEHTNFERVRYNKKTTPPPGGFPPSAINVDEPEQP